LYKDANYYEKTIYSEVDIVIGNVLDKVSIALINPQLSQEYLSANNLDKYVKDKDLICNVREVLGVLVKGKIGIRKKNDFKDLSIRHD
jgi:hypothetical protein